MGGDGPARWDRRARRNRQRQPGGGGRRAREDRLPICRDESSGIRLRADSWVGPIEEHVCEEISRYEEKSGEQDAADDYVEIAGEDGFEQERTEAGPAHDDFHQERAAEQGSQSESE